MLGGRHCTVIADVTDRAAVQAAIASSIEQLGPVDVLVNNAGYSESAPFHRTTPDLFERMFAVHVLGCLVACVLAGLVERHGLFAAETRLFLFTGLLGGFTTFSAFGLETAFLLRRGEAWTAAGYAGASVLLGLAACWVGIRLVSAWPR